MTALAVYPNQVADEEHTTSACRKMLDDVVLDRNCLILSDDPELIAAVEFAAARRCFRFDDYADVEEAAFAALFSPPALAVIDLRLAHAYSELDRFAAFCKQLASERTVQVALIGSNDDDNEEKLFRTVGATYYFPGPPPQEELEQLAAWTAARVRAQQRRATIELLRRVSSGARRPIVMPRHRSAA